MTEIKRLIVKRYYGEVIDRLVALASSSNEEDNIRAAGDWRTPPEFLVPLAERTESEWVLDAMSRNKMSPPEALLIIAKRGPPLARRDVADHIFCPPEAFEILSKDAVRCVRWGVAKRYDAPASVVFSLHEDEDESVRNLAMRTTFYEGWNKPPRNLTGVLVDSGGGWRHDAHAGVCRRWDAAQGVWEFRDGGKCCAD